MPETNLWTRVFMVNLSTGVTVADAMSVADQAVRADLTIKTRTTIREYRYVAGSDQISPCS